MVRMHGEKKNFERDFSVIEERVAHEGVSFLTKTLPKIGKAVDSALQTGKLTPVPGFKKSKGCAFPACFRVLLSLVFEDEGTLRSDPDLCAISDIRQLTYLTFKIECEYSTETVDDFLQNFVEVDESLGWNKPELSQQAEEVLCLARNLLRDLFVGFDPSDIKPRHGPGSVATGEKNHEKMDFKRLYNTIHQVYPYYRYYFSNVADLLSASSKYHNLLRMPWGKAKVVLVPKDSRGPRLISEEPLEYQWIQQGLSRAIVEHVEKHKYTKGQVNFHDQTVNRRLALQGSIPGQKSIVTLDMKQASDRVSIWLVKELFRDTPFLKHLLGTRTRSTELPNGKEHLMRKFAPMGSALCFPIEALTFWALGVAAISRDTGATANKVAKDVFVYGDDIVVRAWNHVPLLQIFPEFKLLFNLEKSCTQGFFRESCGCDAYAGVDITCTKVKKIPPVSPNHAEGYAAYIAYVNSFNEKAYYGLADKLKKNLQRVYGYIPITGPGASIMGFSSVRMSADFAELNAGRIPRRWNKKIQTYEYLVNTIVGRDITRPLDRSELLRKQLTRGQEFVAGVYAIRHCVNLQRRWVSYYQLSPLKPADGN
jgi:hypothetical protein